MYKVGEYIILETSRDGLYGYITLVNTGEEIQLDLQESLNEIKEYFKFGLDITLVEKILKNRISGEKICIAKGEAPINGKDGSIKYNFDLEKPLLPKLNEDGTVNYKELDAINNVKKGDILANIIPPIKGKDGISVNGKTISHIRGKTPKLLFGKNVSLSADGKSLICDIDGLVELKNGRVNVSNLLRLENLDNSVGNIDFDGNVIINKDILNGFTLKAKGSVEVKGAIEGGLVECGGDILVRQGIQGYNRLTINSKGNLSTKFIENSIVKVNMNITAEAIMHSNVSSESNILVLGRKGLIVGGEIRARNEIRARTIGSSMATTTILEVGIDPGIKESYEQLENQLKKHKDNLSKINKSLKVLEVMKRSSKLDQQKLELYNDLVKAQQSLNSEINSIIKKLDRLKLDMGDLSRGKIKVADVIYPGVKIVIGKSYMYIRDEMKRCTFYEENGEIRVGPY